MAMKWKILIIIGFAIALLDQWSKYLAVKHLTPGITAAHTEAKGPDAPPPGFFAEIGYFYGDVVHPCQSAAIPCRPISVVNGFWNWRYIENPGAAFGLLSKGDSQWRVPFFFIVSIGAMVFIFSFFRKLENHQRLLILSMSLIFGGAIGNFIDRLHLNYVIDFIDWYYADKHWPTFNVADSAISVGVFLIAVESILDWVRTRNTTKAAAQSPRA